MVCLGSLHHHDFAIRGFSIRKICHPSLAFASFYSKFTKSIQKGCWGFVLCFKHLLIIVFNDISCFALGYRTLCQLAPFCTCPNTVVLKCGWQIAQNGCKQDLTGQKHILAREFRFTHTHKALYTSCLHRWGARLSAVCSIKWGGFPVMFLSPHPAPLRGPLMSPLPRWCLTEPMQSGMRWAAGPDMREKQTTVRSSAQ